MTRAKKLCLFGLISLLVLVLAAFFTGSWLVDSFSRKAIAKLSRQAERHGVVVDEPRFDRARLAGIRAVCWSDLAARLTMPDTDAFAPNKTFNVRIARVDLWLVGDGQAVLEATDVSIDAADAPIAGTQPAANATEAEQIHASRFRCQLPLDVFQPLPSLEEALPQLLALMRAGATELPIEIEGSLEFEFNDAPIHAQMGVAEVDGGQALVLDPNDMRSVSAHFSEPLTDAELELIASYPLRVARLLRIKQDAEDTAAAAKLQDASVPEDAYRHILWSYLLTRTYGPQFAQRVTNAHEQGDTGNTPAERRMDLHNNELGRDWSGAGLQRNEILPRVLSDPAVVKEP